MRKRHLVIIWSALAWSAAVAFGLLCYAVFVLQGSNLHLINSMLSLLLLGLVSLAFLLYSDGTPKETDRLRSATFFSIVFSIIVMWAAITIII